MRDFRIERPRLHMPFAFGNFRKVLNEIFASWQGHFTSSSKEGSIAPKMAERHRNFELVCSSGNVHDRRIIQVIQALRRQPDQSAKNLGRLVALSASRLQHVFKKQMGMTITTYTRELRLCQACELLETSQLSIKEIRNAIGICDASNFARRFKDRFGTTPSAYRKRFDSSFDQQIAVLTNEKGLRPTERSHLLLNENEIDPNSFD